MHMIDEIKHTVDIVCTSVIAVVMSLFTWIDIQLPHMTMWLSFISMLLSCVWWIHRYYHAWKMKSIS